MASFFDILKQIHPQNIIISVPHELKKQFEQLQLKNSLRRVKNYIVIVIIIELVFLVMNLTLNHQINIDGFSHITIYSGQNGFFLVNSVYVLIFILFILLTNYFSKKEDSHLIIWAICYFFIIFRFLSVNLNMWFTESSIQILYMFSTSLFLNMFIPDFRPRIFISSSWMFYIVTVCILAYKYSLADSVDIQILIFNVFIIIFIIKVLHYNSNAKVFINISKINALNESLSALSITDELTKLNNRRSFLDYMDTIWKQSHRLKLPINVIMIDIDHFKKYNDSMGHFEGDKVLIAVAQCLKKQIKRETDFIARFGGEEFICLLPYIEKKEAENFASKLVQNIENMEIYHPSSEISKYVTVSAGFASIVPDEDTLQAELLDRADKALYMAKHSGKNRVITN